MNMQNELEYLNLDDSLYLTRLSSKFRNRIRYRPEDPCRILSFIPGTIADIFVEKGQQVVKGDVLMILDAMKMQNRLICPFDARISSVAVKSGDKVARGMLLIELERDIT